MKSIEPHIIPKDVLSLVNKWIIELESLIDFHMKEAFQNQRLHYFFGTPSVLISAIIGTEIFSDTLKHTSGLARIILAGVCMISAALGSLVLFYNFSEKGANHRNVADGFLNIKRKLELCGTSIVKMKPDEWKLLLDTYIDQLEVISNRAEVLNIFNIKSIRKLRLNPSIFSPIISGLYSSTNILQENISSIIESTKILNIKHNSRQEQEQRIILNIKNEIEEIYKRSVAESAPC